MNEERKNYEIAFLVKSEEDQEGIRKILRNFQLPVIDGDRISKIKLAYPIKKENFAYSGYLHFSGSPQDIGNLTESLKNEPKILRFSVITQPIISARGACPTVRRGSVLVGGKKDEHRVVERVSSRQTQEAAPQLPKKTPRTEALSNEALEKKLEEILQ